ncbi:type IV conjugative transfer system coupling protein TraD [Marinagarivorans cellulosilyticus]|nr:type IV conjugative transfer system coupling protein TraD [Marinagarivorans cellulosilyticus]
MSKYPIQQLLRPAHEIPVGIAYLLAATLSVLSSSVLLGAVSTPAVSWALALAFSARGIYRLYWGCRLLKYQYELRVLPPFEIASSDIPVSKKELYLGKGFEWRARHTQRRTDVDRIEFDYHKDRNSKIAYKIARGFEAWVAKTGINKRVKQLLLLTQLAALTSIKSWANPVAPIPYVEGVPEIHAVGLWEKEGIVTVKQGERVAHMFVVGTTRVGKTRLAEVLVTQDIHNDEVVIVFDPKGDADLLKRMYVEAKKAGRLHQFYCFHLGFPEFSARYNPVGTFGRITEPASRIASQLPGEGASAAFREFTWRYVNVMSKALTSLGKTITYDNLLLYGADIDPLLKEYLEYLLDKPEAQVTLNARNIADWRIAVQNIVDNPEIKQGRESASRDRKAWATARLYKESGLVDATAHALIKTFEYEKSFYDKLVASLFPLLEKLTSGPTAELLSPNYTDTNDPRKIFDWDSIIRTGGIVYVGLDALSDAEVAQAVGNSMFSDLTSRAGSIYKGGLTKGLPEDMVSLIKKRKICVHADEFNELVGKEFIPLANKGGGANFQLTVYTQTLSDIKARFGDDAKAGQVIGNLGSLVMLRVKEEATAELLTSQLRDVEVNQLTNVSGVTDDTNPDSETDFTSRNEQRITSQYVKTITTADLMDLPKGQAFARLGGKLHKIRLPLFNDESELPEGLSFMYEQMNNNRKVVEDLKWAELPDIDLRMAA